MKKKLAIILTSIFLALSLTACGSSNDDYAGKTKDELETEMQKHLSFVQQVADNITYIKENVAEDPDEVDADYLIEYFDNSAVDNYNNTLDESYRERIGLTDADIDAAFLWLDIEEEYGTFSNESTYISSFELTEAGKTTTADVTLEFTSAAGNSTQDVTFEIVYDSWNMEISGISVDPVQTLGQKMANAGMNTLISMCIVFAVLILISLIIYAFNIFPYIEKKKKEKAARNNTVDEPVAVPAVAETVSESLMDDYELVAVIAAAIAASEGCSTSDFVVRSINRR